MLCKLEVVHAIKYCQRSSIGPNLKNYRPSCATYRTKCLVSLKIMHALTHVFLSSKRVRLQTLVVLTLTLTSSFL